MSVNVDIDKLTSMHKGWFIGDFIPSIYANKNFEVAVKKYNSGDYEAKHLHKLATEVTVIVSGEARMNNILVCEGDIITILPGEVADFCALNQVTTVVVKFPSVLDDKYLVEKN